jgi:hypothetical protein
VEACEPWLEGAEQLAEIVILSPDAVTGELGGNNMEAEPGEAGASQILMELHLPHTVVDAEMEFERFELLIIADSVRFTPTLTEKIQNYVHQVEITDGEVLAETIKPFFNRTSTQFSGHGKVAPEGPAGWPAVIRKGIVVYLSQPVFSTYRQNGMVLHREIVRNIVSLLMPDPLVQTTLPSAGRVTLTAQEKEKRWMLHAMYAAPIKRGDTEVIDDIVPLHDLKFHIRTGTPPQSVTTASAGEPIDYTFKDGVITVHLPRLEISEILVFDGLNIEN